MQRSLDESDEKNFKELAKILLNATDVELKKLVKAGKYVEVR